VRVATIRRRVRAQCDRLVRLSGVLGVFEKRMSRGLTILMYHRVLSREQCSQYPLASLVVPESMFRAQVRWLARHCLVLPVREAVVWVKSRRRVTRPVVSITFDDGYADNFEIAAPTLDEMGIRGTFFVSTGFAQTGVPLWFDRAADAWVRMSAACQRRMWLRVCEANGENASRGGNGCSSRMWMEGLKVVEADSRDTLVSEAEGMAEGTLDLSAYRAMTVEQIKGLSVQGHEVGSHTVSHPMLADVDEERLRTELQESRSSLREWSGSEVGGFCYPNGQVVGRVERAVRAAGYVYACTTRPGLNRRGCVATRLMRIPMSWPRSSDVRGEHDEAAFRVTLCGLRDRLRLPALSR
jgi:peptidoglycan/xylan/chitin deacetylase (PgdA/CDA1 family)